MNHKRSMRCHKLCEELLVPLLRLLTLLPLLLRVPLLRLLLLLPLLPEV